MKLYSTNRLSLKFLKTPINKVYRVFRKIYETTENTELNISFEFRWNLIENNEDINKHIYIYITFGAKLYLLCITSDLFVYDCLIDIINMFCGGAVRNGYVWLSLHAIFLNKKIKLIESYCTLETTH